MAAERASTARRRDWADLVAIVAAVASFAFAIWGTPIAVGEVAGGDTRNVSLIWLSYGVAGLLAIGGVVVAQRRTGLGRILLAAGGVVLLVGLVGLAHPVGAAWASIIPAVLMLASAPFVGPLPTE